MLFYILFLLKKIKLILLKARGYFFALSLITYKTASIALSVLFGLRWVCRESCLWLGKGVFVRLLLIACMQLYSNIALGGVDGQVKTVERFDVNIHEPNVADALNVLAQQTQTNLLFSYRLTKTRNAQKVLGRYTIEEALVILLQDSGLSSGLSNNGAIVISERKLVASNDEGKTMGLKKKTLAGVISTFTVGALGSGIAGAQEGLNSNDGINSLVEEVVVTATRRESSAQDIPVTLQAISGKDLELRGVDGFEGYLNTIPGASFRDTGDGSKRISFRGVSNVGGSDFGGGTTVSTVGLYFNDIPIQGSSLLPDLAVYDLNRIEVLKGPQGTLYGEGAAGGAIRMITNSPNAEEFEAKMDTSVSSIKGGDMGYRTRGMVNIPIGDATALRLVGTYRDNGGFVDNVATGEADYNGATANSIRAILGSQLTDNLSIELTALQDNTDLDGFPQVDPRFGDLKVFNADPEFSDTETSIYSLTLEYDLGFAELVSVSSYTEFDQVKKTSSGDSWGSLFKLWGVSGPAPEVYSQLSPNLKTFAQEFRLVSNGDDTVDWIVGAFYRSRDQISGDLIDGGNGSNFFLDADLPRVNAGIAANIDFLNALLDTNFSDMSFDSSTLFNEIFQDEYEQVAVYGEVNIELNETLELTLGLRWFDEEVESSSQSNFGTGGPFGHFPDVVDGIKGSVDGFLPKVNLSYRLSENHLLYALAAKGFRSPAPNFLANNPRALLGVPLVEPDYVWNYELGAKTTWLNGQLQMNAYLYYIDWSEMQGTQVGFAAFTGDPAGFRGNAGDAEVLGFEFELAAAPTQHISVGFTFGYTDGELVKSNNPDVPEGSELPNTPELTASAHGEYRFDAATFGEGFVRLDISYIDEQTTKFPNDNILVPIGPLDGYSIASFQVGLALSDHWSASLFVNNLTDKRAVLGRGIALQTNIFENNRFTVNQPRTVGLTVGYEF